MDETYAITAYLLNLNHVIEDDFILDQSSLAAIEMPNRDGFIDDVRPDTPTAEPCMKDCKGAVEVVFKAKPLAVTPEGETE